MYLSEIWPKLVLSGGDSVMNTRSEGTVTQVAPFLECMQCGLISYSASGEPNCMHASLKLCDQGRELTSYPWLPVTSLWLHMWSQYLHSIVNH